MVATSEEPDFLVPRDSLLNKVSKYLDNDRFLNKNHPDYIPGTYNIYLEKVAGEQSTGLKTSKNGIILHPQPTDSPNDPLNWSVWTKTYQFFILIFITAFTSATANDAGATQDDLNAKYGISYGSMNTGAGVLFAAIALCTFILGPTSSLYGRKLTYLTCISLGLIGAAWFASADKTSDTIWSQLFVGASEGCAEACVQLSISDMFYAHQLGWALTAYILATSVGTYLGPLIAGFITEYTSFRWVGWIAVIISGALLVFLLLTQYETYFDRSRYVPSQMNPSDLQKIPNHGEEEIAEHVNNTEHIFVSDEKKEIHTDSTSNISKEDSIDSFYIFENGSTEARVSYWKRVACITPATNLKGWGIKQYFERLFLMLRVFWFPPVVLSGLLWGLQDAFLTFYLTTEDDQYYDPPFNLSNTGVALMNIPTLIGAIIGCIYAGILSDKFVAFLAKRRNGISEAEDYLYFLIAVFIACPIGLMVFAAGTDQAWGWGITYTFGLGFLGFSFGCSGDIAMSYLMAAYPEMVIEGMIGVAIINNVIGCIFTFVCSPWLDAMGNTNTYAILTGIQVIVCLSAIPFLIWGKAMRKWTKPFYLSFVETRDGVERKQVHNKSHSG